MNGMELVASWLTPSVLFCVMNVMIGTIFFRSRLKPPRTKQQHKDEQEAAAAAPRFERVSSFLKRVKSFNLARYEADHQPDPVHQGFPDPEPAGREAEEVYHEIEESPHATRANCEAAREREEARHEIEDPRHLVRTIPAAVAEAARGREEVDHEIEESYHVTRAKSGEAAREREEARDEIEEPQHVARTKSGAVGKSAPAAKALKKSASEKNLTVKEKEEEDEEYQRRPETARLRAPGDTEVDQEADDFIIKFRKQLKLQRMDSIVRYNEMIDRGAGRWR